MGALPGLRPGAAAPLVPPCYASADRRTRHFRYGTQSSLPVHLLAGRLPVLLF